MLIRLNPWAAYCLIPPLEEYVAKMLPHCQHGFRAEHGCDTAVTMLVQQVAEARDVGDVVLVASLDGASAFDTVPHEMLLQKLESTFGIGGQPLQLLRSYLADRRQRVRLSGERRSAWRAVESGVPQGAVLSPLLYALYTIGVEEAVRSAAVIQYCDDVTLVARGPTAQAARQAMDAALAEYHQWSTELRILPEPTKTQLLLSGSVAKLRAAEEIACTMAGADIRPASTIKVLGVLVDSELSWGPHAEVAARRARNAMHAVQRAARHLPRADRARLMAAMCHPYIDYCSAAMAHPSARAERMLQSIYERTARVAAGLAPDTFKGRKRIWRTRPALKVLHGWPTWARRRAASRAAWAMTIWHRQHPHTLRQLLRGTPAEELPGRLQRKPVMHAMIQPRSRQFGPKMFACWAPAAITHVLQGTVL
eukprot:gene19809-biopygen15342